MASENVEVGKRLALTNTDWDNISAVDILSIFNSFCKGEMIITKVQIFPSLYGIEQMKHDSLYGPPKEMFNVQGIPIVKRDEEKADEEIDWNEFKDDDDLDDEGVDQRKLRLYEINKMKYFYAVIHCNKKKTA